MRKLADIEPMSIAACVGTLQTRLAAPPVNKHLAAIKMLFDWMIMGQVLAVNPASAARGPKHSVKKGTTPVLISEETRTLLDSIDLSSPVGLRDRALIALMVYSFGRVGATLKMRVEDVYLQGQRTRARLHEKGDKRYEMPCHHNLETYLHAYMEQTGIANDAKGVLSRTGIKPIGSLSDRAMSQPDAWHMIRRRAAAAGVFTKVGNHSFRATGVTEYVRNGGKLEIAQQTANNESSRTTGLYDRRNDQVSLDEVETIGI